MRENEQTDKQVAQYSNLCLWLFWPTVQMGQQKSSLRQRQLRPIQPPRQQRQLMTAAPQPTPTTQQPRRKTWIGVIFVTTAGVSPPFFRRRRRISSSCVIVVSINGDVVVSVDVCVDVVALWDKTRSL